MCIEFPGSESLAQDRNGPAFPFHGPTVRVFPQDRHDPALLFGPDGEDIRALCNGTQRNSMHALSSQIRNPFTLPREDYESSRE